ncbi:hypothetical protein GALL_349970 [mine drainage metagenome]|uniref:Uncharacterized protein n=1 Tax=mine drainage metagenome TaxID=410659 RepID=A0A1J5R4U0_9ZZZZ
MEGDELHDLVEQVDRLGGLVGVPEALGDVGEAHHAEADRAVLLVRPLGLRHRRQRDVDEVVELTDRVGHRRPHPLPVEAERAVGLRHEVLGQVDRREVADRDVVAVLRQRDLGAEVRQVDRARVVVQGPEVDGVLPGQPRVRRGLQGHQDRVVLLARLEPLERADLPGLSLRDVVRVTLGELAAVQLDEIRRLGRVEQVPVVVGGDALHELVRDPHRGVGRPHAAVRVAGVLLEVEELGEVQVPVLHVERERPELLAAARDRPQRRVDRVHEGDRAGRGRVVGPDRRSLGAQLGHGQPDATGALGQPHDVADRRRDVLDVVLHLHDEAVGELRVGRPGVDQGRARRQVVEPRDLVVEPDRPRGRVGLVEGQPHRDPHPEVLRDLEGAAVAVVDHVAVAHRDGADVAEQVVTARVDRGRERVEVEQRHEPLVEQPLLHGLPDVAREPRLVQQRHLEIGLVVAEHALGDDLAEQPRGDRVEVRVVLDVLHRDADRGLVELLGRDAVEQCDRELGGDLHGLADVVLEADCGLDDGLVDLVRVVELPRAVPLGDVDLTRLRGGEGSGRAGRCRRPGAGSPEVLAGVGEGHGAIPRDLMERVADGAGGAPGAGAMSVGCSGAGAGWCGLSKVRRYPGSPT